MAGLAPLEHCLLTESIWRSRFDDFTGKTLYRVTIGAYVYMHPEYGQIFIESSLAPDLSTTLTVHRADPKVLISHHILVDIRDNTNCPHVPGYHEVGVRLEGGCTCDRCVRAYCFFNMMLHIDASNGHYVWRINEFLPDENAWVATWPD
jgi:hypothetical protein